MRKQYSLEEPIINLTPLIDVVFVILIMFIVVAPLLEVDRVELADGPTNPSSAAQEKSTVAIHLYEDNRITFNHRPVSLEQLASLLLVAKEKYPQCHPQLFPDRKSAFGSYQSIKNAVEAAGFTELDVILKPQ